MLRVVAIVAFTAFVTGSLNLFAAAAVEIRGGGLHSGPLERLDARGVRVGGVILPGPRSLNSADAIQGKNPDCITF